MRSRGDVIKSPSIFVLGSRLFQIKPQEAAVYRDLRTGDVACLRRSQERDHRSNLLRLSKAPGRNVQLDLATSGLFGRKQALPALWFGRGDGITNPLERSQEGRTFIQHGQDCVSGLGRKHQDHPINAGVAVAL